MSVAIGSKDVFSTDFTIRFFHCERLCFVSSSYLTIHKVAMLAASRTFCQNNTMLASL